MKSNIKNVNFLKVFSFFTIFLLHAEKITLFSTNNIARLGVEIFLMLSGFLIMYNYKDKFCSNIRDESIKFTFAKVKKFYPLFLLGLLIKLPATLLKYFYEFGGLNSIFLLNTLLRFFPSIFMFQAYIPNPDYFFAFNGVSWYLNVLILCYFFTPYLVRKIRGLKLSNTFFVSFLIFVFQIIYILLINKFIGNDYWYYIFPLYRILDFVQGMLICNIFFNTNLFYGKKELYTIFELVIIFLIVLSYFCGFFYYDIWIIVISYFLLLIFLKSNGYISKILSSSKLITTIALINLELYFLHQPIIRYFEFFLDKISFNNYMINIILFVLLCITVFLVSKFYNKNIGPKIDDLIKNKFRKKVI